MPKEKKTHFSKKKTSDVKDSLPTLEKRKREKEKEEDEKEKNKEEKE